MSNDGSADFDPKQERVNVLAYLRRESLDLFNRLHSISEDVSFVNQVHELYPHIPLLRTGFLAYSWLLLNIR